MSIVLELEPEVETALERKASAKGLSLNDYIEELVRKEIVLDEILAPVRQQFAENGMTEDDLDKFFNGVRQKVFEERYPKRLY